MTDAPAPRRLAELYRASLVPASAVEPEALLSALAGHGSREARDEILSQASADPVQAALLRTLSGLRSDVDELQREVRALRRPGLRQRPLWSAVAASLALAAVVTVGLRPGHAPQQAEGLSVQEAVLDSDRISAVSFESPSQAVRDDTLFRGNFDS